MERLTIRAADRESGCAMLAALSGFRTELLESAQGCEVVVTLCRDGDDIDAALRALEQCLIERGEGPAQVELDGRLLGLARGAGRVTNGAGAERSDVALDAAFEQAPGSCWARLLGAADELVHTHQIPVEEVTARISLCLAHGHVANGGMAREEASFFFNQAWPG
jgi:hypothetical protein